MYSMKLMLENVVLLRMDTVEICAERAHSCHAPHFGSAGSSMLKCNTPPQAWHILRVCECIMTLYFGSAFMRMSVVMS